METTSEGQKFTSFSYDADELKENSTFTVDYIVAPPRMRYYIQQSAYIYVIYMHFVSPEDIHICSVDEVFMDVTHYLKSPRLSAREFVIRIIKKIL